MLENDWVEAIVALPTDLFYNTGIQTYVWLLTNRKPAGTPRQGAADRRPRRAVLEIDAQSRLVPSAGKFPRTPARDRAHLCRILNGERRVWRHLQNFRYRGFWLSRNPRRAPTATKLPGQRDASLASASEKAFLKLVRAEQEVIVGCLAEWATKLHPQSRCFREGPRTRP